MLDIGALEFLVIAVVALVVVKTIVIAGLCRLSGLSTPASVHAGCVLSAGGEFAFVLFSLAASGGLMSTSISAVLVAAVVISMAMTPLLAGIGANIASRVAARAEYARQDIAGDTADLQDHVLIAGFGRVGQSVAKMMTTAGVPWYQAPTLAFSRPSTISATSPSSTGALLR